MGHCWEGCVCLNNGAGNVLLCLDQAEGNVLVWIRLNSMHKCLDKAKHASVSLHNFGSITDEYVLIRLQDKCLAR